jgi:hypothetical protein
VRHAHLVGVAEQDVVHVGSRSANEMRANRLDAGACPKASARSDRRIGAVGDICEQGIVDEREPLFDRQDLPCQREHRRQRAVGLETAAAFVAGTEERPMARTAPAARLRIASGDRPQILNIVGNAGQPGERRIAAENFVAAEARTRPR